MHIFQHILVSNNDYVFEEEDARIVDPSVDLY